LNAAHKVLLPRITLSLSVVAVLAAAPLAAQEPVTTQPKEHVVRRGDTLWDLAKSYLADPFLWPSIFEANRTAIKNPHWIYPQQRFLIPGLTDSLAGKPVQVGVQEAAYQADAPSGNMRTRFYRQAEVPDDDSGGVAELTLEKVEPYLVAPDEYEAAAWLADTAQLDVRGRLLRLVDPYSAANKLPSQLHPYDRVYIDRLNGEQLSVGDGLLAIRVGRKVKGYGQIVTPLAVLRVDSVTDAAVIARVERQYADATEGDPVITLPEMPELPRGSGQLVLDGETGQIVEFKDVEPLYGTTDHAFISMGRDKGLNIGDELMAFGPETRGKGTVLISTPAAKFRVVRVEDQSATVRVLSVMNTALMRGLRVQVVSRTQ
jgi:hypothetical protein